MSSRTRHFPGARRERSRSVATLEYRLRRSAPPTPPTLGGPGGSHACWPVHVLCTGDGGRGDPCALASLRAPTSPSRSSWRGGQFPSACCRRRWARTRPTTPPSGHDQGGSTAAGRVKQTPVPGPPAGSLAAQFGCYYMTARLTTGCLRRPRHPRPGSAPTAEGIEAAGTPLLRFRILSPDYERSLTVRRTAGAPTLARRADLNRRGALTSPVRAHLRMARRHPPLDEGRPAMVRIKLLGSLNTSAPAMAHD
jgi:hypothetical protein